MGNNFYVRERGITMIEILIVIAIVGILSMIAVPSFVRSTQNIRVAGHASALAGAMTFARSEAIKRGAPVTLCASTDGKTCLSSAAWAGGWMVFTDPAASKTVGTLLKVQPAVGGTETIGADNSVSALTFSRDGFTMALPAATVTFTIHTTPADATATRCVAVSKTGRLETQVAGAGNCA